MSKCSCNCDYDSAPMLIFHCSGSSDTGEIADRAARKMTREGKRDPAFGGSGKSCFSN
ncbi:MAG: hypothetical protein WC372_01150 [Candidatus Neomarinimicrobiota bacterium]|jgi:uncharacterized metal-binding protein